MPKQDDRERKRVPLSELTAGRLARAIWAETTLKDKPGLDQNARKELWKSDREHYVELCRNVLRRLRSRAEDGEDEDAEADRVAPGTR